MSMTSMFVAAAAFAQLPVLQEGAFWQDQTQCVGKQGNQECHCPDGMSIVGVQRTANSVDGIDYFKCAKAAHTTGTKNCVTTNLPNTAPWPHCPAGKVLTGIHTSCGQRIYCIDRLVCCDYEVEASHTVTPMTNYVNWWACLDRNQQCDAPDDIFLTGFYRHPRGCSHLYCIEGAHGLHISLDCPAHSSGDPCECDNGYAPYGKVPITFSAGSWSGSCCPTVSQGVTTPTGVVPSEQITAATHTGASGLELVGIPEYLQGTEGFFPVNVVDKTTFSLDCCGNECTFFVAVYHCSPCSQDRNGKLIAELLGKGWEGSSCAPKFVVDSRGYPMTILHKTTTDSLQLETEGSTDFIAIFKKEGGVNTPLCPKSQGPSAPGNCNTQCAP